MPSYAFSSMRTARLPAGVTSLPTVIGQPSSKRGRSYRSTHYKRLNFGADCFSFARKAPAAQQSWLLLPSDGFLDGLRGKGRNECINGTGETEDREALTLEYATTR
jgi:hypothetical protein